MLRPLELLAKPNRTVLALIPTVLMISMIFGYVMGTYADLMRWGFDDSVGLLVLTVLAVLIMVFGVSTDRIDTFSPIFIIAVAFLIQYSVPGFILVLSDMQTIRSGVPFYELGDAMVATLTAFFAALGGFQLYMQSERKPGLRRLQNVIDQAETAPRLPSFYISLCVTAFMVSLFILWVIVGGVSLDQLNALDDDSAYGAAARSASVNLVFLLKSLRSWPLLFFLDCFTNPEFPMAAPYICHLALYDIGVSGYRFANRTDHVYRHSSDRLLSETR